MAVTYNWVVEQMSCYPEVDGKQDVVFSVAWRLFGTEVVGEVTYTATVYGTVGINTADLETFTPYDELTQEQVVGWVQDALGAEQVAEYETNVANQIANQVTPKVVNPPLPWVQPAE